MQRTVSIPLVLFVWVVIGVVVAINKDYGRALDDASQIATFILAVILWPIPATDGVVLIAF
ncbi:MAG TPA: hypothetical protein VK611_11875 [Acidimicrobiales bacterium]|nr:hypothetical protein [Acidimicrobiales bacterium]